MPKFLDADNFDGAHFIITGGSAGLGAALAKAAVDQSASVHVLDVDPVPDERVEYTPMDVSDADAWHRLEIANPPDAVFLNAGVMSAPAGSQAQAYRFLHTNQDSYKRIVGVNLDGVIYGVRALSPLMPPDSCIIVTVSMAGLFAYPFDPLYAMTKHALVGFVRSVQGELGERGIRIHAYCPNRIQTSLRPSATKTAEDLSPEVAAKAALDLLHEPSSGYAWIKESANKAMFRHPAEPVSRLRRVLARLTQR